VTAVGAWISDFSTLAKEEFGIVRWLADEGIVVVGSIALRIVGVIRSRAESTRLFRRLLSSL